MKFLILGIISLQTYMITGQFMPLPIHNNRSSIITALKRTSRSAPGMKTDRGEQKCHGCQDENAGQCTRKTLVRVKRYTEQLKCLPAATLVKLHVPAPYYSVEPAMARVHRCSGYCRHGFHTCLPVQTSFLKIPVILRNHRSGSTKCVEYEVEQHEQCACDCEIRMEHCSERHKHENCLCKCQNEAEKYQCLEDNKVWSEEKCECMCDSIQVCPSGFVWDTMDCRCAMVSPSDLENLLY